MECLEEYLNLNQNICFILFFTILRGEFNSPFYTNRHSKNQNLSMLDEVRVSGKNLPVEKNNKLEIRYTEGK